MSGEEGVLGSPAAARQQHGSRAPSSPATLELLAQAPRPCFLGKEEHGEACELSSCLDSVIQARKSWREKQVASILKALHRAQATLSTICGGPPTDPSKLPPKHALRQAAQCCHLLDTKSDASCSLLLPLFCSSCSCYPNLPFSMFLLPPGRTVWRLLAGSRSASPPSANSRCEISLLLGFLGFQALFLLSYRPPGISEAGSD